MRFDRTVTVGNLLTVTAIVVTLLGHGLMLADRLGRIETKVDAMWTAYMNGTFLKGPLPAAAGSSWTP